MHPLLRASPYLSASLAVPLKKGVYSRPSNDRRTGMARETLERRDDLFQQWQLRSWFGEQESIDPAFEDSLRSVWETLFSSLYDDLSERLGNPKARDALFLEFTNTLFPSALDNYKWYASEKRGSDIGLLAALDRMATEGWYIELLSRFSQTY